MAKFQVQDTDGSSYVVEANTPEEADAALNEMRAGGQQAPSQDDMQGRFQDAFDQGDPENMAAFRPEMEAAKPDMIAAADEQMNGEADDRGRWATAGNALTMGFGDEVMGLMAGGLTFAQGKGFDEGYDRMTRAIRGDIGAYAERHPVEHAAIDVAASLPTAMVPGGAAVRGAGLMTKVARGAAAGAAYGGVRGFGEGEGGLEPRLESAKEGAKFGGAVGAAVPIIGNTIGKAVGKRLGRGQVPGVQQLDDAATALYQRADQAGVAVQPRALQRLTAVVPQRLGAMGFDPVLHPNTARAMAVIEQRASQGVQPTFSLGEIENMRRIIREAIKASSGPNGKADRQKAQALLGQFDMWMNGLQPRDMLAAGPVSGREAIGIIQEARGLWARKSKGDILADIVEDAQLEDDVTRGIRQGFKRLAKSKERIGQFTKSEQEAIRKVARGGDMGWVTRSLGMLSPTSLAGAARGAAVGGIGIATGNPIAAALPMVGYGAKKLGDAAISRSARQADAVVRAGGSVPISPKGKVVGDYATRLFGTAGQAGATQLYPPQP